MALYRLFIKSLLFSLFILFLFASCQNTKSKKDISTSYNLWYNQPAQEWTDALPVGNGRLGAMVFGGTHHERIQFNEESLWAGTRRNCNNPQSKKYLDEVQQLLLAGKNNQALGLAEKYLMGVPPRIRSYQTFGDIFIDLDIDSSAITNYKRQLHLNTGIAVTGFSAKNTEIVREVFASAPDNTIFIHIKSENANAFTGKISMQREQDATVTSDKENALIMEGQIIDKPDPSTGPGGAHMKFASVLKVLSSDGKITSEGNVIQVTDASHLTLALTAATDYNLEQLNFDRTLKPLITCFQILDDISGRSYEKIKTDHTSDHKEMFERMSFNIGNPAMDSIPTDKRLQNVIDGQKDDHLIALYFQYGRYLLMGSSRKPGKLPANLQGVWNHYFNAPWNSDYHTNINVQMNYWPSEVCNLSETSMPYVNFFNAVRAPGAITANEMYGANGWTMHHATNAFGRTAVQDAIKWGMFPMGASWVCFPVWRHFEFTVDTAYLENTAWPVIRGAVEFINDFLIESPEGYLVTAPSYSPENTFYLPGSDEEMRLTYGPTMDIMIIREIYSYALSALEILKTDQALRATIINKRDSLPPIQVSDNGTIQEWIKDYREAEPGHRHISHLIALHPGTRITEEDSILFHAARETIEHRLSHGGGHTGWSRAWIINFYARLLDGDEAYHHLNLLLQKSTLKNLFDTHPPFQIDGNFGGTAGIAEMLLQSHRDFIHLLPALPAAWDKGQITGLKARGNYTIDMSWEEGVLISATIQAAYDGRCRLKYNGKLTEFDCKQGKTYQLNDDFVF
jgi:alpha-L-fucosidase 2